MLKNSTISAPDTRKQPVHVWVKSYFFHKLPFGDIKLSDLECRNRKLSAHDCTDHIKRPFSFDNYHETRNINTSPPCCSTQATIVDRYSIIPHTQHTYRISAKTTWQLWNVQLILIVAIVGVILNEDLLANTVVASRFQFLIIFSERESPQ